MSDPTFRLPARPSRAQLRKQAKELLREYRAGAGDAARRVHSRIPRLAGPEAAPGPVGVTLVDAQFVLAREYGFESWAALVRHLEAVDPNERLGRYERLAADLVDAYRGEAEPLRRLNQLFPGALSQEEFCEMVERRLTALSGPGRLTSGLSPADAQLLVARLHGFEGWPEFVEALTRPPAAARSAAISYSPAPPFYRIDWENRVLEPGPLMSGDDWEAVFGVMEEHGLTGIRANGLMTDAALERLPRLAFVTRLEIGGSKRVTDDGLRHLMRMPQLRHLDLSDYPGGRVTDRGLEALRHLPELRTFQMCWQRGVTDEGVSNLAFCDRLEEVNLLGTPTGDGVIRALAGKPHLRQFKTGRLVTDAGLPFLHQFPAFKAWQGGDPEYGLMSFGAGPTDLLLDGPFTDAGLSGLAGLDGLFGLSFFWHAPALTAAGLRALAGLSNLGYLGCQGALCDDEAMRHIGALPRLRMLMGQGTVAGDDGFAALSRSQTIEYVWGRECPNLGGRGFAALAAMPSLRGLAVSCKNVGDVALSALPRFPSLRSLLPMDVPDDGFRHVGRCERLEELWCMYCRDTGDAATEHLAGLPGLKSYYAGATRITDRSLDVLGRMASLESLAFHECAGVTDAGMAVLAGLPRLREIAVEGCANVTRAGMSAFPAAVRVRH